MELSAVPHQQLIGIYHTAAKEIKRRKSSPKIWTEFSPALKTFEEIHGDLDFTPRPAKDKGYDSIPYTHISINPSLRAKYLPTLLAQDWTYLFGECDNTKKYYVYYHVDPSKMGISLPESAGGTIPYPFYVGKGNGNRAYDLNRNQGHGIKLKQLKDANIPDKKIVIIAQSGLSELEAYCLESKLIYFFGTLYEKGRRGCLYNLDIGKRPNFSGVIKIDKSIKQSIHLKEIEENIKRKRISAEEKRKAVQEEFSNFTRRTPEIVKLIRDKAAQYIEPRNLSIEKEMKIIEDYVSSTFSKYERGMFAAFCIILEEAAT